MRSIRLIRLILILLVAAVLLTACTGVQMDEVQTTPRPINSADAEPEETLSSQPQEDAQMALEEAVAQNLDTKLLALSNKDLELYMSTVTADDEYYFNEQGRWFKEMTKEGMNDISFEILEVESKGDSTARVMVRQKHFYNESFDITYPLLYRKENGDWKDCGYDFEVLKTQRYTIKYMQGEERVEEFREMLDIAYDNLETIFTEKADENFEIKLFCDQELLRQRTVPSVGWLFTGWGEPNESLKMYTGHKNFEGYNGTLQHELVHHITIKICNNNLPTWILEGIAMYYGNAYFDHSKSTTLSNLKKENIGLTIEYLETMDLYNPESRQAIWDWYNASFMYVGYLIETYGHDKFMELFYEAGKKPFNDSVINENFYMDNINTLIDIMPEVLEITKDKLTERYLAWLETTDYFDVHQ